MSEASGGVMSESSTQNGFSSTVYLGGVVSLPFPGEKVAVVAHPRRPGAFVALSVVGKVVDCEGIDVEILWSSNAMFKVGETYRGLDRLDVLVNEDLSPADIAAFPPFDGTPSHASPPDGHAYQVGGGLELPEAPASIAELMGEEIRSAVGSPLTPERCEAVVELATAARAFLLAQHKARFGQSANSTMENLARLQDIFGQGADDNDPSP